MLNGVIDSEVARSESRSTQSSGGTSRRAHPEDAARLRQMEERMQEQLKRQEDYFLSLLAQQQEAMKVCSNVLKLLFQ